LEWVQAMTVAKLNLNAVIDDDELLGVLSPLLSPKLTSVNCLKDDRIELIMKEAVTHHFKANPKLKLPVDVDLVVPEKITLSFDKERRKVTLIDNPIAILPTFRFFGQWHAADILDIGSSSHTDDKGERWFQITGEVHVSCVVKRALQAIGVAQNTLWVTASIINKLCSENSED